MKTIETLAHHYLIAAVWADAPEDTHPRVTKQAREKAKRIAWQFLNAIDPALLETIPADYYAHPDCNGSLYAAMGHDLWLTSQGHGVGFWDRDTPPEDTATKLTHLARNFSRVHLSTYRGWAYLEGSEPLEVERVAA